MIDNENPNMPESDLKTVDAEPTNNERPSTPISKHGENVEIGIDDDVAVHVNKRMAQPDELCYTWSEVKLHHLTNSELEKYLGKVNHDDSSTCARKEIILTIHLNQMRQTHPLALPIQEWVDHCVQLPQNQHILILTVVKVI